MPRLQSPMPNATAVVLLDSVTEVTVAHRDCVVVTGSHGGQSAGRYALACMRDSTYSTTPESARTRRASRRSPCRRGGPAGRRVAHTSARIGEAADTWTVASSRARTPRPRRRVRAGQSCARSSSSGSARVARGRPLERPRRFGQQRADRQPRRVGFERPARCRRQARAASIVSRSQPAPAVEDCQPRGSGAACARPARLRRDTATPAAAAARAPRAAALRDPRAVRSPNAGALAAVQLPVEAGRAVVRRRSPSF